MFDGIKIVGFFKENAIFIKTLIGKKMVLAVSSDSNVTLSGFPFVNIIIIIKNYQQKNYTLSVYIDLGLFLESLKTFRAHFG